MNKAKPWLAGGLLVVAVWVVWNAFLKPAPELSEAIQLRQRALEMLGGHLLSKIEGDRVLVVSNPYAETASASSKTRRFEEAALRGLKKSLGVEKELVVDFPAIQPEFRDHPEKASIPTDSTTPLSFIMAPDAIDRLLAVHSDCALVISLVGLPVGVEGTGAWQSEIPFALLKPDLRVLGSKGQARKLFREQKILAAVVTDKESPDPVIIDQESIDAVLASTPEWLGFKSRQR